MELSRIRGLVKEVAATLEVYKGIKVELSRDFLKMEIMLDCEDEFCRRYSNLKGKVWIDEGLLNGKSDGRSLKACFLKAGRKVVERIRQSKVRIDDLLSLKGEGFNVGYGVASERIEYCDGIVKSLCPIVDYFDLEKNEVFVSVSKLKESSDDGRKKNLRNRPKYELEIVCRGSLFEVRDTLRWIQRRLDFLLR